jgi:hypothetical protein
MGFVRTILVIVALGLVVLAVHIYVVTRHRVDPGSRGMARIDLHQPIDKADADRITAWLYRQKGVDHVLVSTRSAIAVFTYLPRTADAGRIVSILRDSLSFPAAKRYLPSAKERALSCPMTATPATNRIYEFLKRIF